MRVERRVYFAMRGDVLSPEELQAWIGMPPSSGLASCAGVETRWTRLWGSKSACKEERKGLLILEFVSEPPVLSQERPGPFPAC
jgi:hypothetical protein